MTYGSHATILRGLRKSRKKVRTIWLTEVTQGHENLLRYMRRIGRYVLLDMIVRFTITVLATGYIQRSERRQRAGLCTTQRRQIVHRYMVLEQKGNLKHCKIKRLKQNPPITAKSSGHHWNPKRDKLTTDTRRGIGKIAKNPVGKSSEEQHRQNSKKPCGEKLRGTTPAK